MHILQSFSDIAKVGKTIDTYRWINGILYEPLGFRYETQEFLHEMPLKRNGLDINESNVLSCNKVFNAR